MLARAYAPALYGVDGRLVSIECDITNGLPGFVVVGLGDKAVEESRERIRSAIKNSGLFIPPKRITLNLAPADLPKDGSGYDLGMAVAILAASGQIDSSLLEDCLFLGELALDGSLRPVKGSVMAAQLAQHKSLRRLFVATENAPEASLIEDTKVFAIDSLIELFRHLIGDEVLPVASKSPIIPVQQPEEVIDLSNIYGQDQAKRALEIAAAGNHNILLSGPPGAGKTLLAKSLLGLLPAPTLEERIEITKMHSLAGHTIHGIVESRPFRAPHHTASSVALIGGGTKPRPGEISLSHGGVLFLDELPEFPRDVLEVLRQPLEDGTITVARAAGVVTFPARFMLVATRNPCPCGYLGDYESHCRCPQASIAVYQRKLSGPLMDRIDLMVDVARADNDAILQHQAAETSQIVASRIARARYIQTKRYDNDATSVNASMSNSDLQKYCKLDNETSRIAAQAMRSLNMSARAYMRTLKVARTIADLDESNAILIHHFTEALQYRPRLEKVVATR